MFRQDWTPARWSCVTPGLQEYLWVSRLGPSTLSSPGLSATYCLLSLCTILNPIPGSRPGTGEWGIYGTKFKETLTFRAPRYLSCLTLILDLQIGCSSQKLALDWPGNETTDLFTFPLLHLSLRVIYHIWQSYLANIILRKRDVFLNCLQSQHKVILKDTVFFPLEVQLLFLLTKISYPE